MSSPENQPQHESRTTERERLVPSYEQLSQLHDQIKGIREQWEQKSPGNEIPYFHEVYKLAASYGLRSKADVTKFMEACARNTGLDIGEVPLWGADQPKKVHVPAIQDMDMIGGNNALIELYRAADVHEMLEKAARHRRGEQATSAESPSAPEPSSPQPPEPGPSPDQPHVHETQPEQPQQPERTAQSSDVLYQELLPEEYITWLKSHDAIRDIGNELGEISASSRAGERMLRLQDWFDGVEQAVEGDQQAATLADFIQKWVLRPYTYKERAAAQATQAQGANGPETAETKVLPVAKKPEALHESLGNTQGRVARTVNRLWNKLTGGGTSADTAAEKSSHLLKEKEFQVGNKEFQELRHKVAAMYAYEGRTAFRGVDRAEMAKVLQEYEQTFLTAELPRLAEELAKQTADAEGREVTELDVNLAKVEILNQEKGRRERLKLKIIEDRGGKGSKFINWYRRNPHARFLLAAGIGAGGLLLPPVGGVAVVTGGLVALRAAMRGAAAYNAAQQGQESLGARRDRAKAGSHKAGSERHLGPDNKWLSDEERMQRLSNIYSARQELNPKYEKEDEAAIAALSQQLAANFKREMKNLPEGMSAEDKIAELFTMQMSAENKRLVSDKRVGRKRFVRSLLAAGVGVALPVGLSAVEHIFSGGPSPNHATQAHQRPSIGRTPHGAEQPRHYSTRELLGQHFADRDWTVKSGQNMWLKSHEVLQSYHRLFHRLDPTQRLLAIDHLDHEMGFKNLIYAGQQYEIKGAAVRKAFEAALAHRG